MAEPFLIDTPPLRDQRTMCDVTGPHEIHQTTADVETAWQTWADREGLTTRRRQGDWSTDLRRSRKTIVVFVSGGKWIGDCPECNGGVAAWPFHEKGCCLDCGTIFRLEYPPVDEVEEIAQLLARRPEQHRNYHPHQGETIDDLRRENAVWQYPDSDTQRGAVDLATLERVLAPRAYQKLLREIN